MTLTKSALVEAVYTAHNGMDKQSAVRAVESFFEVSKEALISGDDLLLSGFGKFKLQDKRSRRGRNPQTGEALTLEARRIVTFHASGLLRNKINEPKQKKRHRRQK